MALLPTPLIGTKTDPTIAANAPANTIKKIIQDEYMKCVIDPVHFMSKYCFIQHPVRGKIPFVLYSFQKDVLNEFKNNDYNVVLKSRQLGISTLVAGYSLWLMMFNQDKSVLVIATKQDVAKNLVTKVRVMQQNLPSWLKNQCVEDNKLSLRFKNGSQIKAISSSPEAGRSESLSLLILDECLAGSSYVQIRNKKTLEIQKISIEELYGSL